MHNISIENIFVQNRFKSKNVENQKYFLEVCRYVHRNPEKAYIAKTEDYEWSSYKEYIGKERLINKKILLHYYNDDLIEFIKYTKNISDIEELNTFAEYEIIERLTDEQLTRIIMKKFDIDNVEDIAEFFKDKSKSEEKRCLKEVKNILGTNITQVARVTRIGRKKIEKIKFPKRKKENRPQISQREKREPSPNYLKFTIFWCSRERNNISNILHTC